MKHTNKWIAFLIAIIMILTAGIGALADTAAAREALFLFGAETEKVVAVWQTAALFALVFAVLAVQIKIFAKIFKKLWKKSNL